MINIVCVHASSRVKCSSCSVSRIGDLLLRRAVALALVDDN